LLASGALVALSLSTVGFALAHRARALHLGTGAAFGGLYLSTGALVASVVAHWVYNVLVRSSLDRGLSQSGTVP
jgi:membrane protease YdiL (CAAX protease family)